MVGYDAVGDLLRLTHPQSSLFARRGRRARRIDVKREKHDRASLVNINRRLRDDWGRVSCCVIIMATILHVARTVKYDIITLCFLVTLNTFFAKTEKRELIFCKKWLDLMLNLTSYKYF